MKKIIANYFAFGWFSVVLQSEIQIIKGDRRIEKPDTKGDLKDGRTEQETCKTEEGTA